MLFIIDSKTTIKIYEKLFLFDSCYKDQLEYNNVISAFYANDKESGYECCKRF